MLVGFCVLRVNQQLQGSSSGAGEACADLGVTITQSENIGAENCISFVLNSQKPQSFGTYFYFTYLLMRNVLVAKYV